VPLCEEESGPGFHAQLAFSGRGGVTVLKQDDQTGSTLMPRLMPGTMLHEAGLDPAEEVASCCNVIQRFGSQQLPEAIPIESWYEPFLATDSAEMIPDDLLKEAQRIAGDLLSTANDRVLLHCDLHHYNLLLHGDEWLAIDPKGVMGDPYLEPAAFLRNPIGVDPDAVLQATRIQTFADLLGLKAARIQAWGVVHNVLSAWWCEPLDRQHTIRIVEAIRAAPI
jgi:streptomycin 6-kinase